MKHPGIFEITAPGRAGHVSSTATTTRYLVTYPPRPRIGTPVLGGGIFVIGLFRQIPFS